jgi:1-acyl-sn-glycerol-3-phosphate acyltransferase
LALLPDPDDLDARDPALIKRAARLLQRTLIRWHRATVEGIERVPDGAALFVGNHNAGMYTPDSYVFFNALYTHGGVEALPYALGHEIVFNAPGLAHLVLRLGAVRACHENAARLFARGERLLVYPGGDLDALRPFSRRNEVVFGQRRGYIRLALTHGVPIVPVVSQGSHQSYIILTDGRWLARMLRIDRLLRLKVMPVVLSFPFGITVGPAVPFIPAPTRVRVRVLPPIHFDRSGPDAAADIAYVTACAAHVEGEMQRALVDLADA